MHDVNKLWQRIEDWYARQGAAHLLNAGAIEEQIAAAEAKLGFRLPTDLRESFARHNGTTVYGWPTGHLFTLEQMLAAWRELAELEDGSLDDENLDETVRTELERLAEDVLLPIDGGAGGQSVLELNVQDGQGMAADELCVTMTEILAEVADMLEGGKYVYHTGADVQGIFTQAQAETLAAGAALEDILNMEEHKMDEQLNEYLRDLLNDLDVVAETHGEISDTDCREQLFDAVYNAFLKPKDGYELPQSFGLFSDEGNAQVRAALERYTTRARARAEAIGLSKPNERLAAFNAAVASDEGTSTDEYFGWVDSLE